MLFFAWFYFEDNAQLLFAAGFGEAGRLWRAKTDLQSFAHREFFLASRGNLFVRCDSKTYRFGSIFGRDRDATAKVDLLGCFSTNKAISKVTGSVSFILENVDLIAYQAAGTNAGGEVYSLEF